GRESVLQKVHWAEDGWLRLSEPEDAFEAAEHKAVDRYYDFSGSELPKDFQWLRVPDSEHLFSMTAAPGKLRLYGRESIGSLFYSSLVARRQEHFDYVAETRVSFDPDDFQQMAGLVAYYNGHKFHYLHVTWDEDKGRCLDVMSCNGDLSLSATFPLEGKVIDLPEQGDLWLRCRVEGASLRFDWSVDGETWRPAGPALDASVLSDEAGKGEGANFTGAFIGMTCQDLTGRGLHADFDHFRYRET
ncbi:MAG: hypothetical protein MI861_28610, partial [Pirellulales bacterium]|nr:hypothetical protein [Pirellulales bacterium]